MGKDPIYQEFQLGSKTIYVPEQYKPTEGPVDSINYILVVEDGRVSIVASGDIKAIPNLIQLAKRSFK